MASVGDLVATLAVNSAPWTSGLKKAQADLKGFTSSVSSSLGGVMSTVVGALGAGASIMAAQEDVAAMQKLNAVLSATGGTAGVTGEEIGKLAKQLQGTTGIADDATVSAAALLATFKNINGGAFKETLGLAQDLSALKGIGLTEAVTALGKALNDPAEGLSRLTKMGVMFTDAEKKMIKEMDATGNSAGAQQLMLKALQETIGGVAEASASPLQKLSIAFQDIGEEIGGVLLPYVKAFANVVIPFLTEWGNAIGRTVVSIGIMVAAIKTVNFTLKAMATAQALVMALGGPGGWAALATGMAIFAATAAGIAIALNDVAAAAENAGRGARGVAPPGGEGDAEIDKARGEAADVRNKKSKEFGDMFREALRASDGVTALDEAIKKMRQNAEDIGVNPGQIDFVQQHMIEKATGFATALESIRDQTRILTGEADEATIALEKLQKAGLDPAKIREMEDALRDKRIAEKDKETKDKNKNEADAIRKAVMTPAEKLDEETKRIGELLAGGFIDEDTYARALKKAQDEFERSGGKGDVPTDTTDKKAGALAKGSAESVSAVLQAMRSGEGIPKKQLEAEEQQVDLAEKQVAILKNMEQNGIVLFGGSFA